VANGYTDGKKDYGESDIDCGGNTTDGAPLCADNMHCVLSNDCTSGLCSGTLCTAPSNNDGIKDGTETDIDCGGGAPTNAPACPPGKMCKVDADCKAYRSYLSPTGVCNDAGICAYGPSCRHADGGYSCGPTKDQDCCKSPLVTVSGVARGIDSYKITAGRMREFTNQLNGDVTGWYMANRATLPAAVTAQLDPYLDVVTGKTQDVILPSDLHSFPWGVDYQLGGTIYTGNFPSGSQGCYVGAKAGAGAGGAEGSHTYDNGGAEGDQRGYTTAYLDRLPINCVTYVMLASFCAWDGGRLSTRPEHVAIGANGGGTTWIWGTTPTAGGWARDDDQTIVGPATSGFLNKNSACPTCDVQHANWQWDYEHIRFDPANDQGSPTLFPVLETGMPARDVPINYDYYSSDTTYFISPPGRFPYDAFPNGNNLAVKTHYDVMGLMIEMHEPSGGTQSGIQADGSSFCTSNADCITNNCCLAGGCKNKCQGTNTEPTNFWNGGSWEGHGLKGTYTEPMMTKYGKTTGRCARD
jgi:hypothetical protein